MSVNQQNVPVTNAEDDNESGLKKRPVPDQAGNNPRAETGARNIFDDQPEEKHLTDGSSNSDQNNRLRNNPNDPTDRDPTRTTNKPLSGKNQA